MIVRVEMNREVISRGRYGINNDYFIRKNFFLFELFDKVMYEN